MTMTFRVALAVVVLVSATAVAHAQSDFARERAQHETSVGFHDTPRPPLPAPPAGAPLELIEYPSEVGRLGAYITPDPGDGERHPAIVWITGGRSNTLGDMWTPVPRNNDQSAAAYREAGIVLMLPTLRGGNQNPGNIEIMFGEIDDILSAADYLAALPWVDPDRIYLGGHSVGGTTVFLAAEATDRFRAVFSFGPIADGTTYGYGLTPVDFSRLPNWERRLRSPIEWMDSVSSPLFVIEAVNGNGRHLEEMQRRNSNSNIRFTLLSQGSHFSILAPVNEVIAQRILIDNVANGPFEMSTDHILSAFQPQTKPRAVQEADEVEEEEEPQRRFRDRYYD